MACYFVSAGILLAGLALSLLVSAKILALSAVVALAPMIALRVCIIVSGLKRECGYDTIR